MFTAVGETISERAGVLNIGLEGMMLVGAYVGFIGAYYGGQLARAGHDVTVYARGENLTVIRRRGLEIRTPEGSTIVQVAATDRAGLIVRVW